MEYRNCKIRNSRNSLKGYRGNIRNSKFCKTSLGFWGNCRNPAAAVRTGGLRWVRATGSEIPDGDPKGIRNFLKVCGGYPECLKMPQRTPGRIGPHGSEILGRNPRHFQFFLKVRVWHPDCREGHVGLVRITEAGATPAGLGHTDLKFWGGIRGTFKIL